MSHDAARLSKIRKLLALAEDPSATPAEAAAFTEKAVMLMARHGIDEAMLAATGATGRVANRRLAMPSPYARDKATLAAGIAQAMRCKAVLVSDGQKVVVQVFGFDADLRSVDTLLSSLLVQASHELARAEIPAYAHVAAFRRSWWAGFAYSVHSRLEEATRTAEAEAEEASVAAGAASGDSSGSPSVALVLAHRADEVDEEVAKTYPHLKRGRTRRLSGGGHAAGYASGQRVDIGTSAKLPVG